MAAEAWKSKIDAAQIRLVAPITSADEGRLRGKIEGALESQMKKLGEEGKNKLAQKVIDEMQSGKHNQETLLAEINNGTRDALEQLKRDIEAQNYARSLKKWVHETLGYDETDPSKNGVMESFFVGFIDGMMLLPEFVTSVLVDRDPVAIAAFTAMVAAIAAMIFVGGTTAAVIGAIMVVAGLGGAIYGEVENWKNDPSKAHAAGQSAAVAITTVGPLLYAKIAATVRGASTAKNAASADEVAKAAEASAPKAPGGKTAGGTGTAPVRTEADVLAELDALNDGMAAQARRQALNDELKHIRETRQHYGISVAPARSEAEVLAEMAAMNGKSAANPALQQRLEALQRELLEIRGARAGKPAEAGTKSGTSASDKDSLLHPDSRDVAHGTPVARRAEILDELRGLNRRMMDETTQQENVRGILQLDRWQLARETDPAAAATLRAKIAQYEAKLDSKPITDAQRRIAELQKEYEGAFGKITEMDIPTISSPEAIALREKGLIPRLEEEFANVKRYGAEFYGDDAAKAIPELENNLARARGELARLEQELSFAKMGDDGAEIARLEEQVAFLKGKPRTASASPSDVVLDTAPATRSAKEVMDEIRAIRETMRSEAAASPRMAQLQDELNLINWQERASARIAEILQEIRAIRANAKSVGTQAENEARVAALEKEIADIRAGGAADAAATGGAGTADIAGAIADLPAGAPTKGAKLLQAIRGRLAKHESVRVRERDLKTLESEQVALAKQAKAAADRHAKLLTDRRATAADKTAAEAEVQRLDGELVAKEASIAQVKTDIGTLKYAADQTARLEREYLSAVNEYKQAGRDLAAAEKAKRPAEDIARLRARRDEAMAEVTRKDAALQEAGAEIDNLMNADPAVRAAAAERLAPRMRAAEESVAARQTALDELKANAEANKQAIFEAEDRAAQSVRDLSRAVKEEEAKVATLEKSVKSGKATQAELDSAKEALASKNAELDAAKVARASRVEERNAVLSGLSPRSRVREVLRRDFDQGEKMRAIRKFINDRPTLSKWIFAGSTVGLMDYAVQHDLDALQAMIDALMLDAPDKQDYVLPTPAAPANPSGAAPANPSGAAPANPSGAAPANPSGATPVNPSGATPGSEKPKQRMSFGIKDMGRNHGDMTVDRRRDISQARDKKEIEIQIDTLKGKAPVVGTGIIVHDPSNGGKDIGRISQGVDVNLTGRIVFVEVSSSTRIRWQGIIMPYVVYTDAAGKESMIAAKFVKLTDAQMVAMRDAYNIAARESDSAEV